MRRLRLGRFLPPVRPRGGATACRIMGVDPGTLRVGYAVLAREAGKPLFPLAYGVIRPGAGDPIERRLLHIHDELSRLIRRWKPDAVALEAAFFGKSIPAALRIGEGRGAALVAAAAAGVPVTSYAPSQVKKAVVGHGTADKRQVQAMTQALLGMEAPATPLDASDALAIALCHVHRVP